jgi:exodeoxyribonuclease-3
LRIDHLLLNRAAAALLQRAGVDRAVRGREKPSDHAPAWVEMGSA